MEFFRKLTGMPPKDLAIRLPEITDFCNAIISSSDVRLPEWCASNMAFMSAWASIALYFQLPLGLDRKTLPPDIWKQAADPVAHHLMNRMQLRVSDNNPDLQDIHMAMSDAVVAFVKMWIFAFSNDRSRQRFTDIDQLKKEISDLIHNSELELLEAMWLRNLIPSDEDDLVNDNNDNDDYNDESDMEDEETELIRSLALQFNFCALSQL